MKIILITVLAILLFGCGAGNNLENTPNSMPISVAIAQAPPSTPLVIVAIGDSETAGAVSTPTGFINIPEASYPSRLQGLLGSKAIVHNLGRNSENLVEVWCNQFFDAVKLKPDVLIISSTLNDAGDMMDMPLLRAIYSFMPTYLPNTRIILLTPLKPHVSISPSTLQLYTTNLYDSRVQGIEVFDIGAYDTPEWYCGHQDFHPCEYGYREMARYINTYLNIN